MRIIAPYEVRTGSTMDSAPDFGSGGSGFESLPVRHFCFQTVLALASLLLSFTLSCGDSEIQRVSEVGVETPALFTESSQDLGVRFQHESGATGRLFMPETTGSGVGLLDFDRDGDLDLYLVQGGSLEGEDELGDRLFRNDLGRDDQWQFVDVTQESEIGAREYGQGVAVADVDNDGFVDLFVANFGPDQLWINQGDGRFRRATTPGSPSDGGWSASAVFLDIDNDHLQDLYVTRYLQYTIASHKDCFFTTGAADYCKPTSYSPMSDLLYRNLGGGLFEEVKNTAIGRLRSNGLGVVAADLNEDSWVDIYVANDQMPNTLWTNDGSGRFEDTSLLAGVALNASGMAEASMGVVAVDIDGDGHQDLFMTHLDGETDTFFRNLGDGLFEDQTRAFGLAGPSLPRTSFGVSAIDHDLDGRVDLAITNGAVHIDFEQHREGASLPLAQVDQLLQNLGGEFRDITGSAGAEFSEPGVGRGLASGDLDNDGDHDLVLNRAHGTARLFVNDQQNERKWIGFRIEGAMSIDVSEGCRIEIVDASGTRRVGWSQRGGSYLSSNDPRVVFGVGELQPPLAAVVSNPRRRTRRWSGLTPNRYYTLNLQ